MLLNIFVAGLTFLCALLDFSNDRIEMGLLMLGLCVGNLFIYYINDGRLK